MRAVVFEDDLCERFAPLTLTRHVSQLVWGTRTIWQSLQRLTKEELVPSGRNYLADVTRERLHVEYNPEVEEEVLLVNGRVRPDAQFERVLRSEPKSAVLFKDRLVVARVTKQQFAAFVGEAGLVTSRAVARLAKELGTSEGHDATLFENIWEIVQSNGYAIVLQGHNEKEMAPPPRLSNVKGPSSNLMISAEAEVDEITSFDVSKGPVIIDDGAHIEAFSQVAGPSYIGPKARLHAALIRSGTTIGEECRIGGEVENSIVMSYTNKSHHGYIGDSIVGEWVNLGAGSTFSNLKNTYGSVKMEVDGKKVDTNLVKLGPMVGDMAKVSIGCMVFAGKKIGVGSQVMNLVRDDVPSFTLYDGRNSHGVELKLESAILTQQRMMDRRGMALSKAGERLIEYLFDARRKERRLKKVKKEVVR